MSTSITKTPDILFEQDFINEAGPIGAAFFENILGMSIADVLITDEAELSDFSFCGGDSIFKENPSHTLNQAYASWDAGVLAKIQEEYGLELATTHIHLVTLFAQLEALSRSTKYLQ